MNLGLAGKVALIAGASRGIGAATASVLSAEGASLMLAARDEIALEAQARRLGNARSVAADFTEAEAGDLAVRATLDGYGRIDVLVVSIGAAQGGLFWELGDAAWRTAFELKFMGMVRLLRAAAPVMRAQGSGSIVVVVGNNGRQPGSRMLPGSAANAACLAVVKGLADELAASGVRVNAINPGPTRTGRWDVLMSGLAASSGRTVQEEEASQLAGMATGRINEAEEVARLIAVLASDLAPNLVGAGLTVDGGATKALP